VSRLHVVRTLSQQAKLAKLACANAAEQGIGYWCLLDIERGIPQQPEAVRRRVMVRARATVRWYQRSSTARGWHVRRWWQTRRRIVAIVTAGLATGVVCVVLGLHEERPTSKRETARGLGPAALAPPTEASLRHSLPGASDNAYEVDEFWKPFPRTALSWHKGEYPNPQ